MRERSSKARPELELRRGTGTVSGPVVAFSASICREPRKWSCDAAWWLLASLALLAVGCGEAETVPVQDSEPKQAAMSADQESYPRIVPKVTELVLGGNPGSPWTFRPRDDLPVWHFSLPIDWSADPFDDRSWQHHLHAWRPMEYWLHKYREDGDTARLLVPARIALDWHRFHVEEGRTSAFQWHDHSTGIRASRLAFLLDFILAGQVRVSEADLARLMTLADLHVEELMAPEFLSRTNHGLFQLVGLDALCSVVGWRDPCRGARSYARAEFTGLVKSWFSDEGVHLENSPTYHGWVTRNIRMLGAVERFEQPEVEEILKRADAVSPWLTYPDGRWVPVGDSQGTGPKLAGPVELECLPDGVGCWAMGDFNKSGYVVIRSLPESGASESSMLFVSAMVATRTHKHSDDLSFVLVEWGREIFVDSGRYNKDEARTYVESARAHNVPSLVGRAIAPTSIDPANTRLDPVTVEEGRFVVTGVASRPGIFLYERTLSYYPGARLVVEDRLSNLTDSRWQSNLHLAPDLIPEVGETGFVVRAGAITVRAEFSGDGCDISAVRGGTDPYQGWVSVGELEMTPATVVIATCPPDLVESSWDITFER